MPRRVNDSEQIRPQIVARVLRILVAAATDWGRAPSVLERELRGLADLRSADRRWVGEAVYGMIRWRRRLTALCGEADTTLAYELWRTRLAGLAVDAPAIVEDNARLPALGERWSFPDWIVDEARRVAGDRTEDLLVALNQRAPLTVRANRLRTTREALHTALADEGVGAQPVALAPDALELDGHQNAYALAAFKDGRFEIQDVGSQLICELVAPPPGGLVVDACAGAGGKSLALGAQLGGKGRLIACDVRGHKLEELRRRARRAGLSNLQALAVDAATPLATLQKYVGKSDRVLVDAPCTGLGVLRRHPEARWRLAADEPRQMATIQLRILHDYAPLVAVGGRMIYATCSLSPTENDEVVEQFLRERDDFIEVTAADVLSRARAEKMGDGRRLRVLPHTHGSDGFFAAVMRRVR